MNVVSLKIKNFLSITDVEIRPGQINQIVGSNNQGKTSIIKAFEFAAKGSSNASLVRHGADAAEVIFELDDGTIAKRRLTSQGKQTLNVTRDEMVSKQPQTYLDGIFQAHSFNPVEILNPKDRGELIMKTIDLSVDADRLSQLVGIEKEKMPPIDFKQHGLKVIDQLETYIFQRRSEANKTAADKKKRFEIARDDLPRDVVVPVKTKAELESQAEVINAKITELELKKNESIKAGEARQKKEEEIQKLTLELNRDEMTVQSLHQKIFSSKVQLESMTTEMLALREIAIKAPDVSSEIAECKKQLADSRVIYSEISTYEQVVKRQEEVARQELESTDAQAFADKLTEQLSALRGSIKSKIMSEVEMPIKGLSYQDGTFLLDEVPIDNLSTSKSIRLAVAIARKLSSKSKLICIDGAEQLDAESYASLKKEIENDGYTYFVTKVGDAFPGDDKVFRMESGAIVN